MTGYDAYLEEQKILKFWEKEKIYKFDQKKKGKVYSIDTPPPTVSGDMHIGHAFSYSQQDFIVRFMRMYNAGKGQVFYPFGTDDNGLPTERLVEKLNNVKSKEVSRTDFIDLCLRTLKEITPDFIQQWKNIGVSADYDLYYSTIDKNSQKMSQKSFLDLYKKKRIYKKDFPTLWCPECQTSIAQAELEDREQESFLTTIKFSVNKKELLIATSRPELLGACVAIFVNPKDRRYKDLKGKKAKIPIFNFEVPIIFDESASIEKATGAMMVCSYGDKYDVDAISRHGLNPRIIFNHKGIVKEGKYSGLKIKEARKRILEDLRKASLIADQKKILHTVNVHDKCGTEIEFLPTEQWFIKILDKKKEFISQAKKIKWLPEFMSKRYENWVNGLNWDWNISRNRHFGVPIPVWECKKCKEIILAEEKELPLDPSDKEKRCPKCKNEAEPEMKVLDTWATSSLTPQIASSLVGNSIKLPYSLRPQAHEIIRTWAFYTIVKSYFMEDKIPWKNIMLSGFVKFEGEKMSKSKGNVVSPKEIIKLYGADAIRFGAASSKLGEDLDYSEKDVLAGKRFLTKLWNASNFVFMNLKDYDGRMPKKLEKIDELFLKELNRVISTTTYRFEGYEYSRAKFNTEEFFWKDFCDNYLEIVKWRVYNGNKQQKESAFYTLYHSLLTILKLIAPITPFITEHIYQEYFKKNEKTKSIHLSEWPKSEKKKIREWGENITRELLKANRWHLLIDIISKIRSIKTDNKKSMNSEIILSLDGKVYNALKELLDDLRHVTNAKEIKQGKEFKVEFI
ncbi:MAG: valine--tRNA ligase [Nanoarchaeota archaeon]